jgi:hypothetical protein
MLHYRLVQVLALEQVEQLVPQAALMSLQKLMLLMQQILLPHLLLLL